jgi:Ca2+/Na+ antiporter
MFFIDLLFALVIALILGSIFCAGCRGYRSGSVLAGYLLVLFIATWAAAIWIQPFGPLLWGVPWLVFFMVGLIVALILASLTPPARRPLHATEALEEAREERAVAEVFNVFFWILIVCLLVVIVTRYVV